MVRSHSLIAWSVVFGFLVASSLSAADKKIAKSPAKKPQVQLSANTEQDPFASGPTPSQPASKSPAKPPQRPAPKEAPWRAGAAEARIEDALASVTQLDFNEAPLQDVVDYLKETHKIEIQIDKRVLEDVNVTAETPVTINVKGIRLESALQLMLRNMQPELTYMIRNEVLLITTPDVAAEEFVTRVYDVGDLVVCRDDHDALWDDYDPLIDIIMSVTAPTSWDSSPPGSISGYTLGTAKVLVVRHTQGVHKEIDGLLERIRDIARKNPNAGVPRRNRSSRPPQRYSIGGGVGPRVGSGAGSGAAPTGAAPKPAEKSANPGKTPKSKPPASKAGAANPF